MELAATLEQEGLAHLAGAECPRKRRRQRTPAVGDVVGNLVAFAVDGVREPIGGKRERRARAKDVGVDRAIAGPRHRRPRLRCRLRLMTGSADGNADVILPCPAALRRPPSLTFEALRRRDLRCACDSGDRREQHDRAKPQCGSRAPRHGAGAGDAPSLTMRTTVRLSSPSGSSPRSWAFNLLTRASSSEARWRSPLRLYACPRL